MPKKPEEFLEHTKLELFQDQVFCFSPKGTLSRCRVAQRPVDFAYAVHSRMVTLASDQKSTGAWCPFTHRAA